MENYLRIASELVKKAGIRARDLIDEAKIRKHKALDDLVTDGDLVVQEIIRKRLKEEFPDHKLDSEESESRRQGEEYMWILDPIDGTKYYARGVPLYSVSLALERSEKLVLGAVYIPSTDQLFCAAEGLGATLNGKKIQCSTAKALGDCSICMEIPNRNNPPEERKQGMARMSQLVDSGQRVRILGVGSIGLCFCAMGGYDAFVKLGSQWKYYDYAAGKVIVEEAGGQFIQMKDAFLAGPPEINQQVIDLLKLRPIK